MANEISLKIKTDAPYTSEEKQELLEAFIDFMMEADGDVDAESAEISIQAEGASSSPISESAKREIIEEFLKNSSVTARVTIAETEGIGVEFNLD